MNGKVPLFVINMPSQIERREFMEIQLGAVRGRFDVRFRDGVNGAALEKAELAGVYDEEKANRPLSRGEIGCALSHLRIYREMMRESVPAAVIMEDDAAVSDAFLVVHRPLVEFLTTTQAPTVLFLSPSSYACRWPCRRYQEYAIHRLLRAFGTYGYMLNLAAARVIEEYQTPVHAVADCWVALEREGLVKLFGVVPSVVAHSVLGASHATIADERARLIRENRSRESRRTWVKRKAAELFYRWAPLR